MFEFTELDGMARATMLLKQREALSEWRATKAFEALWDAFGNDASKLIDIYQRFKTHVEFLQELQKIFGRGRQRQEKIARYLEKLDAYMHDMDTRLSDGTKWYNAQDIQEMANQALENGVRDEM